MKPEEKYIDHLFETARLEEPVTSFEEVSDTFLSSSSSFGFDYVKELLLKNINLNSIFLFSIGTSLIFGIWYFFPSENPVSEKIISPTVTFDKPISSSQKVESSSPPVVLEKPNVSISNPKKSLPTKKAKKKPLENSLKELKKIKKEKISSSPSISSISEVKEILPKEIIIPSIQIENQTQINPPKPEIIRRTTQVSPWVASGNGGITHTNWTFEQNKIIRKQNDKEKILQLFLKTKYLKNVFEKDEDNEFSPLVIVTNHYFDQNAYLLFDGKKIGIMDQPVYDGEPFINITKFKIKKKKAYLNFDYKNESIKIQLKKVGRRWVHNKLMTKNSSGKYVNITF